MTLSKKLHLCLLATACTTTLGCASKDATSTTKAPETPTQDAPASGDELADAAPAGQSPAETASSSCSGNENSNSRIRVRPVSGSEIAIGKGSGRDISASSGSWCCTSSATETFHFAQSHTVGDVTYTATYTVYDGTACTDAPIATNLSVRSGESVDFCVAIDDGSGNVETLAPAPGGDPVVQVLASNCGGK